MKKEIDRINSSANEITITCLYTCSKLEFEEALQEAGTIAYRIRTYRKNPLVDVIYVYVDMVVNPTNLETSIKMLKNLGFVFK